jgi:SAM-dependent methyltransferase
MVSTNYNSVLKTASEVEESISLLRSMNLFPHHGREKSWDTYKMIDTISKSDPNVNVLDVGCNGSPILPLLKKLGFKNLYGCDMILKTKYNPLIMKFICLFYKKEYAPIIQMHQDDAINLSIQNIEKTNYQDGKFDYITALSVIEHGVNIQKFFKEANRLLKKGGLLLISTDYWPSPIINKTSSKFNHAALPDRIFTKSEVTNELIETARLNGLELTEPIDFEVKDKVVHWKVTGLDYTFIFFALKKI